MTSPRRSYLSYVFGLAALLIVAALIMPVLFGVWTRCGPTTDQSSLRLICQEKIIYAQDHNDRLPEATDVWDHARLLAEVVGLNDARMWQSKLDPASNASPDPPPAILAHGTVQPKKLDPTFRLVKPSLAVPLGKLDTTMPATTPIAWTRGLQPDGTWAKHSPYGDEGGYIAFLNGNVQFFKTLSAEGGQLIRFDQNGQTANILEALPPGSRVGEYVPTPVEQKEWSMEKRASPR